MKKSVWCLSVVGDVRWWCPGGGKGCLDQNPSVHHLYIVDSKTTLLLDLDCVWESVKL